MPLSLCFVLALSASATVVGSPEMPSAVSAAPVGEPSVDVGVHPVADDVPEVESGFWAKYFPWWLDENLHPLVEENLVMLWLANIFPGGFLWAPYILTGVLPGEQYYVEALFAFTFHILLLSPAVFVAIIPLLGIIALYGWMAANYLLLMPIASINALNRALKRRDAEGAHAPRQGRRMGSSSSSLASAMAF